jgi:hypothetical protein
MPISSSRVLFKNDPTDTYNTLIKLLQWEIGKISKNSCVMQDISEAAFPNPFLNNCHTKAVSVKIQGVHVTKL